MVFYAMGSLLPLMASIQRLHTCMSSQAFNVVNYHVETEPSSFCGEQLKFLKEGPRGEGFAGTPFGKSARHILRTEN